MGMENISEHEELLKLYDYIENGDVDNIARLCKKFDLEISEDGTIKAKNETLANYFSQYYDFRQYATKILLNSVYGSLLNGYGRFYDDRVGQSVTMTGKCITRHMMATVNQIIAGKYDYEGEAICYGDTDSCYFSIYPFLEKKKLSLSKEEIIKVYDNIAKEVNKTFPIFVKKNFGSDRCFIQASRELVIDTMLLVRKKKYACLYYDKEGKRVDTDGKKGEYKFMGLEIKRSDTPESVQNFMQEFIYELLEGSSVEELLQKYVSFVTDYVDTEPWLIGIPKKVSKYNEYYEYYLRTGGWSELFEKSQGLINVNEDYFEDLGMDVGEETDKEGSIVNKSSKRTTKRSKDNDSTKKKTIPGHIKASIAWNELLDRYNIKNLPKIKDGSKIVYCKLVTPNEYGNKFNCIAYPKDEEHRLPEFFKKLPFDVEDMLRTSLINKIETIFEVLGHEEEFRKINDVLLDKLKKTKLNVLL